jgi:hypothetical protein
MSPYFGWQPACFLALVESALHAEFAHYPRDYVEANVAGARRAGLQAHQVTGPDQIAAISEALLEL